MDIVAVGAQAGQILVHDHRFLTVVVRSFANFGETPGEELGGHPPHARSRWAANQHLTNPRPDPKIFSEPS
jgi:hypothetical protein